MSEPEIQLYDMTCKGFCRRAFISQFVQFGMVDVYQLHHEVHENELAFIGDCPGIIVLRIWCEQFSKEIS